MKFQSVVFDRIDHVKIGNLSIVFGIDSNHSRLAVATSVFGSSNTNIKAVREEFPELIEEGLPNIKVYSPLRGGKSVYLEVLSQQKNYRVKINDTKDSVSSTFNVAGVNLPSETKKPWTSPKFRRVWNFGVTYPDL